MKSNTKFAVPPTSNPYIKGDAWRRFLRRHTTPVTKVPSWRATSTWSSAYVT